MCFSSPISNSSKQLFPQHDIATEELNSSNSYTAHTKKRQTHRGNSSYFSAPSKQGCTLTKVRECANLSQAQIGKLFGYASSHICNIERNFRSIALRSKLAKFWKEYELRSPTISKIETAGKRLNSLFQQTSPPSPAAVSSPDEPISPVSESENMAVSPSVSESENTLIAVSPSFSSLSPIAPREHEGSPHSPSSQKQPPKSCSKKPPAPRKKIGIRALTKMLNNPTIKKIEEFHRSGNVLLFSR